MKWLLVDLALVLLTVLLLVVLTASLWKRVKRLKRELGTLNEVTSSAMEAVSAIER